MSIPIAVQLYALRNALQEDFEGTVRRIAAVGFAGVELAGIDASNGKIYGIPIERAVQLFNELGLQVPSGHLPIAYNQAHFDVAHAFGFKYIVVPWQPEERFETADGIKAVCDDLNAANAAVQEHGLILAYHNHWFEFTPLEALGGRTAFDLMLEHLDPSIQFELDTYWAKTGGSDPKIVVQNHHNRIPLLHIKDGPAVVGVPQVAVGEGVMDFPPLIAASQAQLLVVELDECATDMFEAVHKSYEYLKTKGLGRGRED